jgi:hypothetical protein
MKLHISSRGLFAFGFVIVVAANIAVLSGVAANRTGEPECKMTLSERELQLPYRIHKENSGMALRLTWRVIGKDDEYRSTSSWTSPAWFNAEKVEELGFKIQDRLNSSDDTALFKKILPKEVFVVLEYDGEPFREAVKRAESALAREQGLLKTHPDDKELRENHKRAEERLQRERTAESRLFAIDVGLDPEELRHKYSDRTRYILARGKAQPRYDWDKKKKEVSGYISELSIASIHVPLEHRQILDSIVARDRSKGMTFEPPRFEVELAYGSRLEPWVVSVISMK